MVCGRCKYEFCWLCLGPFFGYRHTELYRGCPYRYAAVVGVMFALLLASLSKLGYASDYLGYYIFPVFYYVSAYLYLDIHLCLFLFAIYHLSWKYILYQIQDFGYIYKNRNICGFIRDRRYILLRDVSVFLGLIGVCICILVFYYRAGPYMQTMVMGLLY